ncbi:MAG: helix-turn-helix transcriptional regulator [Sphingomonadaceae bacterium]
MMHVDAPQEWADRVTVNASFAGEGVAVELVHSASIAGALSEFHDDNILCRYVTPSHLNAVALYNGKYPQSLGSLSFIPAGIANSVDGPDLSTNAILCRFDHKRFSEQLSFPRRWGSEHLRRCANINSRRIDQAMRWLAEEVRHPNVASGAALEALTHLIAVELTRHFALPNKQSAALSLDGKLSRRQLSLIKEFAWTKSPCPNIAEFASLCDCSAVHIRRLFKNSTGQTLHSYMEHVRIERAKSLLVNSALSINEIAQDIGFSYNSGFSNAFRKAVGCTAREYRFAARQ